MRRTGGDPRALAAVMPLVAGAAISVLVALVVGLAVSWGPVPGVADVRSSQGASKERPEGEGPPLPSPASSPVPIDPPGYSPVEPVIHGSFADPTVIKVAGGYFAYGTNNSSAAMPVATATTPTGPWKVLPGDGLARLPVWAMEGRTWAPEVVPPGGGSGSYVLYFSARRRGGDEQCIGVATASSPAGPFIPREGAPLVCPLNLGGAIDPASYIEADGTRYLLYKSDDRRTAAIHLVRLSPDGLALAGPPKQIMARRADEPVLVEAPDLVRRGGKYVLFYAAGWYFKPNYQTRYAVASSIEGPYLKAASPLQSTGGYGGKIVGPGSADVLADDSGDYLIFHGIRDYHGGTRVTRAMYVARLGWDGARPAIRGVPVRYEAERARLNGCVSASVLSSASGGRAIGPFTHDGCRVDVPVFAPSAGPYAVAARYANRTGYDADLEVSVNGYATTSLRLPTTARPGWASATAKVELTAGWNTISLRRLAGEGRVDYLELR
ncbi:glycoside hydrolase [Actinomadura sp. KC216]|uniref:family 43 glycosylhydrolase n=1 Tax=Actinomadura sp. KC216 TaxID=2530370 RepID=UPI001046EBF3|nr:family 43 glycosylhydrolase [Actinomadura sp. KC216]TDB84768.1 glycoside hydrolase [Actinomadura sp. KC216]